MLGGLDSLKCLTTWLVNTSSSIHTRQRSNFTVMYKNNFLSFIVYSSLQKTSTCCLQTESPEKKLRVWWGNKWSMWLTRVWKEQAWSSTRSQPSPQSTISNMMMTFIFMSMILSKPPRDIGHLTHSPASLHLLQFHSSFCYLKPWQGWIINALCSDISAILFCKCNLFFFICAAEL